MERPRILIVVPSFNTGGTITSLINFVTLVDKRQYQLNVFAITNSGVNKKYIARHCRIIGDRTNDVSRPTKKDTIRNKLFAIVKSIKKGLERIGVDISPVLFRYYANKLDKAQYDYVLAFQEGQVTRFCSYFKSGFKIAWVRSEYSRFIKIEGLDYAKVYDKYDRIVSVSKASMSSFLSNQPQYKDKAVVQYNFLNDERIIQLSQEPMSDLKESNVFTIISVGRIDPVKRFSEIPRLVNSLMEKGLELRWVIVGGAAVKSEYEQLLANIQNYKTENVILLGVKSNPYPFIKKSQLLVSLSSSETFNNTLTEAKILGVPVVTTDYPCAYESIKQGEEGIVGSFEKMGEILYDMISDKDGIYMYIKNNLKSYRYNKESLLDNLYQRVLVKD